MDAVYPEALSRHNRSNMTALSHNVIECNPHMYKRTVKKKIDRKGRFRTQPVTFMEIKEVDEDKVEDTLGHGAVNSDSEKSRSEMDLKSKFEEFSRSLTQRRQSEKSLSRKRLDIMEMPLEKEMDSSLIELDDESDKVDKIVVDSVEEMDKVPGLRQTVQYPQGFIHKSRPSI
jgi:hypothetical protein